VREGPHHESKTHSKREETLANIFVNNPTADFLMLVAQQPYTDDVVRTLMDLVHLRKANMF
jgi:hypothetical protein